MSTLDATNPFALPAEAQETAANSKWARVEAWLSRLSDRFNPILVKEARQALKSKQFSITFTLLLFCGWIWSIGCVALSGPTLKYGAEGARLFAGYFVILAFPMIVIVPVGAFRSLASEREEGTFEVLSVTTLGCWQIISGKLGSAILQMLVYLSAMAPCLAFTYLLRGIELPTIFMWIVYVTLGSLGLSLLGLLLATVTQEKHWQVLLLVLLVVALFIVFIVTFVTTIDLFLYSQGRGWGFDSGEYWIFNAVLLTMYVGYFALFYCLAAGRLTFASENRSTPPRIVLMGHQALFFGWIAWGFLQTPASEWWLIFIIISALHWYVVGIFMVAEDPELSPRVQRRLPNSFLGRLFLTWFNPGPGTGLMFALANLTAAILLGGLCLAVYQLLFPGGMRFGMRQSWETLSLFALLTFSYVTIYLSAGKLMLDWARRRLVVSPLMSLLLQVLFVLLGSAGPLALHSYLDYRNWNYNLIELFNPIWTLREVATSGLGWDPWFGVDQLQAVLLILTPLAAGLLLICLRGIAEEIRKTRVAAPTRVLEEDAQLQAASHPTGPVQISPWDFETPGAK